MSPSNRHPAFASDAHSIDKSGAPVIVETHGRHDPCVGIRATPIVEAMLALVLMDHALRHRAQNADVNCTTPKIPGKRDRVHQMLHRSAQATKQRGPGTGRRCVSIKLTIQMQLNLDKTRPNTPSSPPQKKL
jgi:hypothetical protein